jgi:hypothetical protein
MGGWNSLKERCNWGEEVRRGERRLWTGGKGELCRSGGGQDSQDSR